MKTAILEIEDEDSFNKLVAAAKEGGRYKLAGISNTGLAEGLIRVTFLPNEAFNTPV